MVESSEITLLQKYNLSLRQPVKGYRFSVDALLLAEFASPGRNDKLVELGAGCGVVSLILARRFNNLKITVFEIQEQLARLCQTNIETNLHKNRIKLVHADMKDAALFIDAGSVDYIVSNPPYRPPESGRISAHAQEALARHEIAINISALLDIVTFLLKTGGRLAMIYPAERLAMLVDEMKKRDIEPKKIQYIHPDKDRNARLFLVEGRRCGQPDMRVLPPILLNAGQVGMRGKDNGSV